MIATSLAFTLRSREHGRSFGSDVLALFVPLVEGCKSVRGFPYIMGGNGDNRINMRA